MLCGGHSRRMGRSKAWLPCGNEYLLPRIVRMIAGAAAPVVVAGRRDQDLPALPAAVEVVHDAVEHAGPLAGIAAGFAALAGRCDATVVCSCDHPLVKPAFIRRLIGLLGDAPGVVPCHAGRLHPLLAVYRLSTRVLLEQMLARAELRATEFAERCGARLASADELAAADPNLDSLRNVNDPDTYAQLLRAIANRPD